MDGADVVANYGSKPSIRPNPPDHMVISDTD